MYDLIIVGGGPAAYSAGIYAARYNLNILILSKQRGGLVTSTHLLENWPGEKSITGFDLAMKFENHVTALNVPIKDEPVVEIKKENDVFLVKTESNNVFESKAVIFATGSSHRVHPAKGVVEFHGKGVSYCATCDGMFFKDKVIAMIGGGDSAIKEAVMLSEICKKVYVVVRKDQVKAEPINLTRLENKVKEGKAEILYNTSLVEVVGDKNVEKIVFEKEINGSKELEVSGVFIAIGQIPQSSLAEELGVEVTSRKEVKINKLCETNVPGFYAAGDVTDFGFKQVITAAAQGATAVFNAFEFLQK